MKKIIVCTILLAFFTGVCYSEAASFGCKGKIYKKKKDTSQPYKKKNRKKTMRTN
jgi:hypothetical protein